MKSPLKPIMLLQECKKCNELIEFQVIKNKVKSPGRCSGCNAFNHVDVQNILDYGFKVVKMTTSHVIVKPDL
ncbi:MAG: hypothetical protein ACFFCS_27915 [Candidatus Hodarchaeota archaeon]